MRASEAAGAPGYYPSGGFEEVLCNSSAQGTAYADW